MRKATALGAIVIFACFVLGGCASKSVAPHAGQPASTASAPMGRHPPVQLADSPEGAALGFDRSVRGNGDLKYWCRPLGVFSWYGDVVHGTPSAVAIRRGQRWIVSVTYPSSADPLRYEVQRKHHGYCVARMLPDLAPQIGPSSPGSGPSPYSPSTALLTK